MVNMNSMGVADMVIAVAYFFIPLQMMLYLLRRRYLWVIEPRSWAISILFILFILLCGLTHLFAVLRMPAMTVLITKWCTAVVSVATALTLCWVIPEALSLPHYVREITFENKLMKDFRGITLAMRKDMHEEAILRNAKQKLRRVLPPQTFIDISTDAVPPPFRNSPREVLSLPIRGPLTMHLRRANLNEAQVTWLQDVCVQMKLALMQAAYLHAERLNREKGIEEGGGGRDPPSFMHTHSSSHPHMPGLSASPSYLNIASGGIGERERFIPLSASSSPFPLHTNPCPFPHDGQLPPRFTHMNSASSFITDGNQASTPTLTRTQSHNSSGSAASYTQGGGGEGGGGGNPPPPPSSSSSLPPPPTGATPAPGSNNTTTALHPFPLTHIQSYTHTHTQDESYLPSEEVQRAIVAEMELTRLRVKFAGVLSRVEALVDVVKTETPDSNLTASQEKFLDMIKEAATCTDTLSQ